MLRENLGDIQAFLAVGEERNFTRTTRSVAPTEAGQRLLDTLTPPMAVIADQLASISALRDRPAGVVRITASAHAARTVLWPTLERLLPRHPDVHVELSLDSGFRDIVADRFDAGVRLGEALAKDMVATRIGPDLRMAVVGSPGYFATRPAPRAPSDLADHRCINLRLQSAGSLYAWELEKAGREIRVRVEGQLAFDSVEMIVEAAVGGFGLGFVMEDQAAESIAAGRLVRVMEDWCPRFAGYHLYYPSRRQHTPAFALLLDALRRQAG